MAIGLKQLETKKRSKRPILWPVVVTSYGELNREAIQLHAWVSMVCARKLTSEGSPEDGIAIKTRTAEYRNKFQIDLAMAMAKGQARMILTCGLPIATLRSYKR